MSFKQILEVLQIVSFLSTIIGIPVAIWVFWDGKQKERKDREYQTYHALDEKYFVYLQLCIQNPELDLYYLPLGKKIQLTAEQKIKQVALFEILVAMMERAYVMYSDQSTRIKETQWQGWDNYIHIWCKREIFRRIWGLVGKDFDEKFYAYINKVLETADLRVNV